MRYFPVAAGSAFAIVALPAVGPAKAEELKNSDGKCWQNTSNGNYEWAACPKEKQTHAKGSHSKKG